MKYLSKNFGPALRLLIFLIVLTGIIYPLSITLLAQFFFPWQANGSLIKQNGKLIGSVLIGQNFTQSDYFWGRPSATTPFPYNAANSSGSNLSLTNPNFLLGVNSRVVVIKEFFQSAPIPIDLVTASASGLDPEISPLAAFFQAPHIAKERKIPLPQLNQLIQNLIQKRTWGFLGEPRVNVLQLNLALDHLATTSNHDENNTNRKK